MKTLFCFVLSAIVLVAGCSKNNNIAVDEVAERTLQELYPDAESVRWSQKKNHLVAKFKLSNHEKEAWFDFSGNWKLTETELPYADLPEPVRISFEESEYRDWRIEDVDQVERNGQELFFVLEVEKGGAEFDLYYLADGTLVKAVADDDDDDDKDYLPEELPIAVSQFLADKYPGHKLIDTDVDDGRIEINFVLEGKKSEAVFTLEGEWIRTSTDIRLNDVPQAIKDSLSASEYGTYRVDDVEFVETPDGNHYDFELESGNSDVDIRIFPDGRIEVRND